MANTVKCYRALRSLKVGSSNREFGDLVPEAEDWPNAEVYVRTGQMEVVWVDEDVVKKFQKDLAAANAVSSDDSSSPAPRKKRIVRKSAAKENSDVGIIEHAV